MSRLQSPSSRPGTPLQTPSRGRTPEAQTIAPYLAAVPDLMAPLSPSLSALHAARISLLMELPPEAAQKWCCARCGALRAGYGWKIVRVKRELGDGERGRTSARASSSRTSKKRKAGSSEGCATATSDASTSTPVTRPKNKLQGVCGTCGTKFSMAGSVKDTLDCFPSARRTRRNSAQSQTGLLTYIASPAQADGSSVPATPSSTELISPLSPRSPSPKPQPPSLLKGSPALSHIAISHPDPVKVPFPAVRPSELPQSSASSRSTSPIGGLPPSAVAVSSASGQGVKGGQGSGSALKKRKKSGLARLLAESEKRKEQEQASGSALGKAWGLG